MVEGGAFCAKCGARAGMAVAPPPVGSAHNPIWYQNFYRIRKKVLAIANQYWIEDAGGRSLGYSRQKILAIREDIRVFAEEAMTTELFRVKQDQIMDMWGTYSILDTATGACLGKLRRQAIKSGLFKDENLIMYPFGQTVGRIVERSGRGLVRKYVPFGNLVPEQVVVEFNGQEVAEIKQQFKIIGDIWEVDCSRIPPTFDRRTLLGAMLIMGMIERDRK
jgi:hypothetical protein